MESGCPAGSFPYKPEMHEELNVLYRSVEIWDHQPATNHAHLWLQAPAQTAVDAFPRGNKISFIQCARQELEAMERSKP